ncbi:hypothetical protein NPIL_167101, partial [Nephila pilipes]
NSIGGSTWVRVMRPIALILWFGEVFRGGRRLTLNLSSSRLFGLRVSGEESFRGELRYERFCCWTEDHGLPANAGIR